MLVGLGISTNDAFDADPAVRVINHLERATCARDCGFDFINVGNRYSFGPAINDERGEVLTVSQFQPLPLIAHLAAKLGSDIKFATTMLVSTALHPVQLAEDIATIDTFCSGGLRVGLAIGWHPYEFEAFQIERTTRARRFEELVTVLRELLSCDSVNFDGQFFQIRHARLVARGVQEPRPPIWIGASVDAAVRRAARLGDAWSPSPHHLLSELEHQRAVYLAELTKIGRPVPADRPLSRNIFMAKNRERALELAMPVYAKVYQQRQALGAPELETMRASEEGEMPFIVGNPDDCVEQILAIQKRFGNNILFIGMPHGKDQPARLRAIELLGKEVLPSIRDGSVD